MMWNTGIPESGIELTNFGNVPVTTNWQSLGFSCISPVGCTDSWLTFENGENTFQIDDDNLFAEIPADETGLTPQNIPEEDVALPGVEFNPVGGLLVCADMLCSLGSGETLDTYFHIMPPSGLGAGDYQTTFTITY